MSEISDYFDKLRHDKNHHLGLGDIRLTVAQQQEIEAMFERLEGEMEVYMTEYD
jgi:hypothetical protein